MGKSSKRKRDKAKPEAKPAPATAAAPGPPRWAGLLLFAVALAVRLVALVEIAASPLARFPAPDAEYYLQAGEALRRGGLWSGGVFTMNPLYTVFVGWLEPLAGIAGIRLLQVILGALTSWMIYRIGTRVFPRQVGLAAGAAHALYPMAVLFTLTLTPATLAAAGCAAALLLALKTGVGERAGPAAGVGLLLGLAVLARPNLLLWGAAFLLWYWWAAPKTLRRNAALLFLCGLALPLLLSGARNLAASGHPVLISSNGGVNFHYGNHAGAAGAFSIPPGFPDTPREQLLAARQLAEADTGRSLTPPEVSRYWFGRGWGYLLDNPGAGLLLWLKKAALLVNAVELPINEGLVEYGEFSRLLRIPLPWAGLVIPLGVAGLLLSMGRGNREGRLLLLLALAAQAAGIIPFFVSSRHRLPGLVALLPFAAFAVFELIDRFRGDDRRRLAAGLGLTAAAAVLCWLPLVPTADHYGHNRLGHLFLEHEDFGRAEEQLRKALALDPDYADGLFNLGRLYSRTARTGDAISAYRRVLALQPDRRDAMLNLAVAHKQAGQPEEAAAQYRRLLELDPGFTPARYNLALIHLRAGRTGEALAGFEEITRLDPGFADAWLQVGMLLKDAPAQADRAAACIEAYLQRDPGGRFASLARSEMAKLSAAAGR